MTAFNPNSSIPELRTFIKSQGSNALVNEVVSLVDKKLPLNTISRCRVLAALWLEKARTEFDMLVFDVNEFFTVAELFRLVQLFDAGRAARQIRRKLEKLGDKLRASKKVSMEARAKSFEADASEGLNVTSSFVRRMRRYVGLIPSEKLDFYFLNFPVANWKALADVLHLKATDFQNSYFLPCCFGAAAPADSGLVSLDKVTASNLAAAVAANPAIGKYWSTLRQRIKKLPDDAKRALAEVVPIADIVYFWEELGESKEVDAIVSRRLAKGENALDSHNAARLNYPKLMERILKISKRGFKVAKQLMPFASTQLASIRLPKSETVKVACIGDCSSSMTVAVETATIIASIFSVKLNGRLTFFNHQVVLPPVQPKSSEDVLKVAQVIRASGSTAPAAALAPYLTNGTVVDVFIMATDEEENTKVMNLDFAPMFRQYLDKVNPAATIFFVSFLFRNVKEGQMVRDLRKVLTPAEFERKVKVWLFEPSRPDLTKFDELLGLVEVMIAEREGEQKVEAEQGSTSIVGSVGETVEGVFSGTWELL